MLRLYQTCTQITGTGCVVRFTATGQPKKNKWVISARLGAGPAVLLHRSLNNDTIALHLFVMKNRSYASV